MTTFCPSQMGYCQQSRTGPAVTCRSASSLISRTTHASGSSPSSSLPPGSSHSARSFSSNRTRSSCTATPFTDTGNACTVNVEVICLPHPFGCHYGGAGISGREQDLHEIVITGDQYPVLVAGAAAGCCILW